LNDCVWVFIFCGSDCQQCDKYLSANSEEGERMLLQYQKEISAVTKPVIDKWRVKWESITHNGRKA
jgi:hypothetical protein